MKIEHIAIWAKDIEVLKSFYVKYFDAVPNEKYINSKNDFCSYFLTLNSGARLEIMQMPAIPESTNDPYKQFTGLIHLAISVGSVERVNSLTKELIDDGYELLDGPRKTGDGYYDRTVFDPEKNRLEITI